MKLTYSLILAAASCGLAYGAATAYTVPVGYITLNIPGAAADTNIAPSLSQAPLLQAASTGIAGNVITVAATGAATNAFINVLPDTNAKTYVLVRTGALAGLRFPVTANDATTITVNAGATDLQTLGVVNGDQVGVVPYWTLNTLFPAGAGVGQSNDIYNPSSYLLFSDQSGIGINRSASVVYFYNDGTDGNPAGWYDNDHIFSGLQDTVAIDPSVMMTIRSNPVGASTTLTITGTVPSTVLATVLLSGASANDENLGAPYPIDTSLTQSGLQSVVAGATDIFNPTEYVFVYADEAAGINKSASATYFYFVGDGDFAAGWYNNDNVFAGVVTDKVLKAGRSFTVRKAGGTPASSVWTAPLPYTP